MTIQQIYYAITISEQGSFNKASEVLYISQPSLTEAVKELEKELGISIFHRSGKGVTLTSDGAEFISYAAELYQRNFDALLRLRNEGFPVALLSNTNPFMMRWARSNGFDGNGHGLDYYFDRLYLSYEMRMMKPAPEIFEAMIDGEGTDPGNILFIDDSARNCEAAAALGIRTLNPDNGGDWRHGVYSLLGID